MKTILTAAFVMSLLCVAGANAEPNRHPHRVCTVHHHHRVCRMVR